MGANAEPSGSLGGPHCHPSPAAAVALQDGLAGSTTAALRHNPGLAIQWSPEEQDVLDHGLAKYGLDAPVVRYAKIALGLPNKTVRDVTLRCRWMAEKEKNKKRKEAKGKETIVVPAEELLEHNAHLLNQISTNMSNMQLRDNLSLLCEARNNILTALGQVSNNVPEKMKEMPPLPKLNEDLANYLLPRPPQPRSCMEMGVESWVAVSLKKENCPRYTTR